MLVSLASWFCRRCLTRISGSHHCAVYILTIENVVRIQDLRFSYVIRHKLRIVHSHLDKLDKVITTEGALYEFLSTEMEFM